MAVTNIVNNNSTNIIDNSTNIDNSKTVNIIVKTVNFGEEYYDSITDAVARKILARGKNAILGVIEKIHFDEKKPENQNVYISNWRDKSTIVIFDNNDWILKPKTDVFSTMIHDSNDYIEKKYVELLDKNNPKDSRTIDNIESYFNDYDPDTYENEQRVKELHNDIQFLLFNNRKMVENTRKINEENIKNPTSNTQLSKKTKK